MEILNMQPYYSHLLSIFQAKWDVQITYIFLAATKQLYEWYFLSVCHTFLTMFPSSYHHEIIRSYHQGPG